MPNLKPSLTSIEVRWHLEVVPRSDIVQVSGQMERITRKVALAQELRIRFDWYIKGSDAPPPFYSEFPWLAEKQAAANDGLLLERQPASELINEGLFADLGNAMYELCKDEVNPAQDPGDPSTIRTYTQPKPVSRIKIFLPHHLPAERLVELDVIHYLDPKFRQNAMKLTKQWVSRARAGEGEQAAEDLLLEASLQPFLLTTVRRCAELVKGIYPTLNVDLDEWMQDAGEAIAAIANPG